MRQLYTLSAEGSVATTQKGPEKQRLNDKKLKILSVLSHSQLKNQNRNHQTVNWAASVIIF